MSQYVLIFYIFKVFIIGQVHLHLLPQANFHGSLQYTPEEIELCANFLALRRDKTMQDTELIFAVSFLCPSS